MLIKAVFVVPVVLIVALSVFLNYKLYTSPQFRPRFLKPNNGTRITLLDAKGIYFGLTVDWYSDTVSELIKRLGKKPGIYHHFVHMERELEDLDSLKLAAEQVIHTSTAVLAVTIVLEKGLDKLTVKSFEQVANVMALINSVGMPVYLRFAHEMNGNWYPYGQRPLEFKKAFINLHKAVKSKTLSTFLVWSPNTPMGYPWFDTSNKHSLKKTDIENWEMLDTNKDGEITQADDPYTPYYPGDEYVDWIGYSVYHFGDTSKTDVASIAKEGEVNSLIDFTTNLGTFSIYQMFCVQHQKPMIIFETAATYFPDSPQQVSEIDVKRSWWTQIYSDAFVEKYPLIKGAIWFDLVKYETNSEGKKTKRDFRISFSKEILNQFKNDVSNSVLFE